MKTVKVLVLGHGTYEKTMPDGSTITCIRTKTLTMSHREINKFIARSTTKYVSDCKNLLKYLFYDKETDMVLEFDNINNIWLLVL